MRCLFKTIGWPLVTIVIGLILFPITLNALMILSDPKVQVRDFQIKRIAYSTGSEVQIEGNTVLLRIPDSLATGDDQSCYRAATVFHAICSLDPDIILQVSRLTPRIIWNGSGSDRDSGEDRIYDHWVPSARNPMTVEWTRKFVDYDER